MDTDTAGGGVTARELIAWLQDVIAPLLADPGALQISQVGETGSTLVLSIVADTRDLPHLIGRNHETLRALERLACLHGRRRGFATVVLAVPQAHSASSRVGR